MQTQADGVAAGRLASEFHVFLSHNSIDKPVVERLAEQLRVRGLKPWLDKWELVPGKLWQDGLAAGIERSGCCAVFLSAADIGAWQRSCWRSSERCGEHEG